MTRAFHSGRKEMFDWPQQEAELWLFNDPMRNRTCPPSYPFFPLPESIAETERKLRFCFKTRALRFPTITTKTTWRNHDEDRKLPMQHFHRWMERQDSAPFLINLSKKGKKEKLSHILALLRQSVPERKEKKQLKKCRQRDGSSGAQTPSLSLMLLACSRNELSTVVANQSGRNKGFSDAVAGDEFCCQQVAIKPKRPYFTPASLWLQYRR